MPPKKAAVKKAGPLGIED